MRELIEEYGFAVIAAVVIIVLIAICEPLRRSIGNEVDATMNTFAKKASKNKEEKYTMVRLSVKSDDTFTMEVESSSSNDIFTTEVRIRDGKVWGIWEPISVSLTNDKNHVGEINTDLKYGDAIQTRVLNTGTADGIYYYSPIVYYIGN